MIIIHINGRGLQNLNDLKYLFPKAEIDVPQSMVGEFIKVRTQKDNKKGKDVVWKGVFSPTTFKKEEVYEFVWSKDIFLKVLSQKAWLKAVPEKCNDIAGKMAEHANPFSVCMISSRTWNLKKPYVSIL